MIRITAGSPEMSYKWCVCGRTAIPARRQLHGSTSDEHAHLAQQHPGSDGFLEGVESMPCRLPPPWPANTRPRLLWRTRFSPEPHLSVPVDPLAADDGSDLAQEAQGRLAGIRSRRHSLGVRPAEMLLERGDVWERDLQRSLRSDKIDLVVTGTHGREGLKKLVLGSEAERDLQEGQLAPY